MQKIQKFLICLLIILFIGFASLEIPTIADWGDYESYDSSSSYDDWGSSDWGSSSSSWDDDDDWGSSWYDDDYGSSYSSGRRRSSSGSGPAIFFIGSTMTFVIIVLIVSYYSKKSNAQGVYNRTLENVIAKRQRNRDALFGVSDQEIEKKVQYFDPMFNKSEFLAWAGDVFVRLQYAWADRNLEEIRNLITPELYEQTNSQVQRYITNKQINKLERISVNISRLYSFEQQGDRDILRIVLESKMNDYIVDEVTGKVLKGDPNYNNVNPYILTFVRKSGVKTEEGGIKPVTMNCPNCGGATTILSSGKCPYCGSIITTRNNNWTLSELKRYNPNA